MHPEFEDMLDSHCWSDLKAILSKEGVRNIEDAIFTPNRY
jgi:hypothetical protein